MHKAIVVFALLRQVRLQSQNQEIKKVVEIFFAAFYFKDTPQLKGLCDYTIILQSIIENAIGIKLSSESSQAFFKSIGSISKELKFQEKMLSCAIHVDRSMAHAWTLCEFYVNRKLSNKGV